MSRPAASPRRLDDLHTQRTASPGFPAALVDHPRFELIRELGRGGFGAVFQAWDRETRRLVALKVTERSEPWALRRFKTEFRAAADLVHPNLAELYELHHEGATWFISMEYVDGVPFDAWLPLETGPRFEATLTGRDIVIDAPSLGSDAVAHTVPADTAPDVRVARPPQAPEAAADHADLRVRRFTAAELPLLRRAFRQIVDAVACLHDSGHVHRDLKPSNVLVSSDGEVKVVDFGLVTRTDRTELEHADLYAGTPSFMAPEVCLGLPPSAASDWYAVGVMLYLALTGALPFASENTPGRVARGFRGRPRELAPDVPADLDELCLRLLSIKPLQRPGVVQLRAAFADDASSLGALAIAAPVAAVGAARGASATAAFPVSALRSTSEWPLAALASTFAGPRRLPQRGPRVVLVEIDRGGSAGATIENALAEAVVDASALVLKARCSTREHLRLRALDGLVDDLAVTVQALGPLARSSLLPEAALAQALAETFPVLGGVLPGTTAGPRRGPPPAEVEAQACDALERILERLATSRRVIVVIDGLEAMDPASVAPVAHLVGPDGPGIEIVLAYSRSPSSALTQTLIAGQLIDAKRAGVHVLGRLPELSAGATRRPSLDAC